jgi:23S rRNA pseudouridine2605 synthase
MALARSNRKPRGADKRSGAPSAGKARNGAAKKSTPASAGKVRSGAAKRGIASSGDKVRGGRTNRNTAASAGVIRGGTTGKRNASSTGSVRKETARKVIIRRRAPKEMPKTGLESDLIRLNKYIASTGVCSRREADELIAAGLVSINGKLITELGVKVSPGDIVKYNGETLKEEKKVYILMNKPKDYVTTVEDPHAKKTVLELVKGACKERVYPVGRLDRNTTGVLLLTNDGDITKRLTHPKFEKLKIYHVHLNKNIKLRDMEKISTGITLEDGFIKADSVSYADPVDKSQVGIEIHSGRNHIVRRIFEHLEYEVVKLDRVYFAGLTKKNLPRGEWRFLSEKEINMLKMNAYK